MHPLKRFWLWSCPVRRRSPGSMWSLVPCLVLNKNYDKLTRNLCDPFKLRECFVTVAAYGQWSAGEDGSASSTTTDNSTASKFLSKSSQHSSICKTKNMTINMIDFKITLNYLIHRGSARVASNDGRLRRRWRWLIVSWPKLRPFHHYHCLLTLHGLGSMKHGVLRNLTG